MQKRGAWTTGPISMKFGITIQLAETLPTYLSRTASTISRKVFAKVVPLNTDGFLLGQIVAEEIVDRDTGDRDPRVWGRGAPTTDSAEI